MTNSLPQGDLADGADLAETAVQLERAYARLEGELQRRITIGGVGDPAIYAIWRASSALHQVPDEDVERRRLGVRFARWTHRLAHGLAFEDICPEQHQERVQKLVDRDRRRRLKA